MMKRVLNLSLSLMVLALGSVLPVWEGTRAEAALVTYQFSGNVSEVSGALFTPGGVGVDGFNSGLRLSGNYTVDTTTAGILPSGLPIQVYNGSVTNLNLSIGNYAAIQGVGTNLTTISSGTPAFYSVNLGTAGNLVKGLAPSLFSLNLADETGTAFSSVALPGTQALGLNAFNVNRWTLAFSNGKSLVGSFDTVTAVPLPATVLLFGAGLTGLVGFGARSRFKHSSVTHG